MGTCKITYNGSVLATSEETGDIAVKYNDQAIKIFSKSEAGDFSITLPCKDKYMAGDLTIGSKILLCNKKIMASDIKVDVNMPSEAIYLFDSKRSDNFLFGEYDYTLSTGTKVIGQVSWPTSADTSNSSSTQIVLIGAGTGFMKPSVGNEGYCNAELKLCPNSEDGAHFANNVVINGYNPQEAGVPNDQPVKICIKAYVEKSAGNPTFAFCNSSGTVISTTTISSTSSATYSLNVDALNGGYIYLAAGTGCGSLIVTDIWIE